MRITLKQRLTGLAVAVVIGVVLLSGFLLVQISIIFEKHDFAVSNSLGSEVVLEDARVAYTDSRSQLALYGSQNSSEQRQKIWQKILKDQQIVAEQFVKYGTNGCPNNTSCVADDQDMANLVNVKNSWSQLTQEMNAWMEQQPTFVDSKLEQHLDEFNQALSRAISYNFELGIASAIDTKKLKEEAIAYGLAFSIALVAVVLVLCYLISRSILNMLGDDPLQVSEVVAKLAKGDLRLNVRLDQPRINSLLWNIRNLVLNLSELANQTDLIGKGDFSRRVRVLSEYDRLSQSINNMTLLLQQSRDNDDAAAWVKDGCTRLSQFMTGDYSKWDLAGIGITELARYLNAGRGAMYIAQSERQELVLKGRYMCVQQELGSIIGFNEGAIGQVARDKLPIMLKVQDDSPELIITGTSRTRPLYIYTYPLLREDTLQGVLELATSEALNASAIQFLTNASELIASFLYVAGQRDDIRRLLEKTIMAEQSARDQSQSLQEVNALLEEQQQQLQQQSEELRQANAQMEEQQQILEQNNQALITSQASLDAKARDLENAGRYKSEFLANMSHELRTPLNAIILLSKMMASNQDHTLADADVKRAEVILRAGKDLLVLINDVLDLSKIEAGKMDLHYAEMRSPAFCSYFQDMFSAIADEKQLEFVVEDELDGKFIGDSDKLSQILRNLLSNAFKFTRSGQVCLRLFRRPDQHLSLCMQVRDTGIGIPAEKQALIFDAFHQADGSTSREFGGTGLGLTISLSLARLMGGTIELSSEANTGSSFTLCLPANPPGSLPVSPQINQAALVTQPEDDRNDIETGDQIILLVDDDPGFGLALLDINRRLGYKTILAYDGQQGMALARQYRPSGILLDLGLPDMDGSKVLEQLKSTTELASIPIYIVSARDHREVRDLGPSSIGYLQKPANEGQLIEAQAALLSKVAQKMQSVLVFSGASINAATVCKLLENQTALDLRTIQEIQRDSDASEVLNSHKWQLVIIDLCESSVADSLLIAEQVRNAQPSASLIFFGAQSLSESEEASLRRYSDTIITQNGMSEKRLLDNLQRFINSVTRSKSKPATDSSTEHKKRLAGHHILVVDDDPRNLFAVTAVLEQQGAKVTCAINGKLGLGLLKKQGFDLILMDIMMPEMDGYEVIKAIRAQQNLDAVPIVALTAKALPQDRKNILAAGADDYLSKPVDFGDLIDMSEKWIRNKG